MNIFIYFFLFLGQCCNYFIAGAAAPVMARVHKALMLIQGERSSFTIDRDDTTLDGVGLVTAAVGVVTAY